jgi:ATP-dependent Clp endopeptidase proteolytic subunit ClpP
MATRAFGFRVRGVAGAPRTLEIDVFDVIGETYDGEGFGAKALRARLKDAGEIDAIKLRVNSLGGDVWDGFASYELLRDHPARVEVTIEGVAASMATVIAMAGDRIEMAANADFMIHEPWSVSMGAAEDLEHAAQHLESLAQNIAATYASRTGRSVEEVRQWMKDETWMSATQAKERGFVDAVLPRKERAAAALSPEQVEAYRRADPAARALMVAPRFAAPEALAAARAAETDTETQTHAAPQAAQGAPQAARGDMSMNAILKALGAASEAEALTLVATLMALTAKSSGVESLGVIEAWKTSAEKGARAEAELAGVRAALAKREKEDAEADAARLINSAVEDGRLPPAKRANAETLFAKFGPDALRAHLEGLSPVVRIEGKDDRQPAQPINVPSGLNAEQRAAAKACGMTEEEMLEAVKLEQEQAAARAR